MYVLFNFLNIYVGNLYVPVVYDSDIKASGIRFDNTNSIPINADVLNSENDIEADPDIDDEDFFHDDAFDVKDADDSLVNDEVDMNGKLCSHF